MGRANEERSHILPKWLLAGFERAGRLFVFPAGRPAYEASLNNVGVERGFYKEPGGLDAEHTMNPLESRLANLCNEIRATRTIPEGCMDGVSEMVFHIAVRTRHLRDGFAEVATAVVDEGFKCFAGEAGRELARMTLRETFDREMEIALQRFVKAGLIPPGTRFTPQFEERLRAMVEESMAGAGWASALSEIEDGFRTRSDMPGAARTGQVRALVTLSSEKSFSAGKKRQWKLRVVEPGQAILGDVGAVRFRPADASFHPLFAMDDEEGLLVAPISHDLVLVEERAGAVAAFDPEGLANGIAEVSRTYFVASRREERELQLQQRVGLRGALMSEVETRRLMEEALQAARSSASRGEGPDSSAAG